MAEYIELEKVLDSSNIITVQTKEYGSIEVVPVDTIASVERVDAQPVKHGHWIKVKINDTNSLLYGAIKEIKCSECNKGALTISLYCPNCGARMDEAKNKED